MVRLVSHFLLHSAVPAPEDFSLALTPVLVLLLAGAAAGAAAGGGRPVPAALPALRGGAIAPPPAAAHPGGGRGLRDPDGGPADQVSRCFLDPPGPLPGLVCPSVAYWLSCVAHVAASLEL